MDETDGVEKSSSYRQNTSPREQTDNSAVEVDEGETNPLPLWPGRRYHRRGYGDERKSDPNSGVTLARLPLGFVVEPSRLLELQSAPRASPELHLLPAAPGWTRFRDVPSSLSYPLRGASGDLDLDLLLAARSSSLGPFSR